LNDSSPQLLPPDATGNELLDADQEAALLAEVTEALPAAVVEGKPLAELPDDLYIHPDALRIFLEKFEGPLDLLLYLIQRQNFDILNIPIAKITQQYLQYIDLMKEMQLDLAADYLVMAAVLMEIKSRLLLPISSPEGTPAEDPRSELVKQLQEYARYKAAAVQLSALPYVGRDIFLAQVDKPEIPEEIIIPNISWQALLNAMQDVMTRATLFSSHQVMKEPLSVRERMSLIVDALAQQLRVEFSTLFNYQEGRAGAVVTLLAILELVKESLIQFNQDEAFGVIWVLRVKSTAHDGQSL